MKERKLTISLVWANIFSLILFAVTALAAIILWHLLGGTFGVPEIEIENPTESQINHHFTMLLIHNGIFLAAVFAGIVVHELVHGITWALFAKSGWKSISFGVIWKMLTPYCHCSEPLRMRPYILGALMPLIVLGFIPMLIGYSIMNGFMVAFGVIYVSAAAGDILVAWKLRREKPNCTVLDHPTEAGCIIYDDDSPTIRQS